MAAATGCNQSLFDANPQGSSNTPSPDASPTLLSCPEPCSGDAVAEFGDAQGGTSNNWFYLGEESAATNGADYVDLRFSTVDGLDSFVAGTDGAAISNCTGSSQPSACAGVEDYLLLRPGTNSAIAKIPALSFQAPESATYQISGVFKVPDGSPTDVRGRLLVSRNGKHDAIVVADLRTSTSNTPFSGTVSALKGDHLIFSIEVADTTPIAFRLFYTRVDQGDAVFPGDCQAAVRFSGSAAITDDCGGVTVEDLNDGIGPPGMSITGPGVSRRLGDARVIGEGQYLKIGNSPMNYSGDFTVQFWSKTTQPQPSFNTVPFADWNIDAMGGLAVFLDDDTDIVNFCYRAHGIVTQDPCITGTRPIDGQWHFWRIVRSSADTSLQLCIDGASNIEIQLPGDADLTSNQAPHIGRNINYNPAYYGGSIDDIRIFSSALPCSTAVSF